jgi:hypothetical protein
VRVFPFAPPLRVVQHPFNVLVFDTFTRARKGTKIIEDVGDIEGFDDLTKGDQALIKKLLNGESKTTEKKEKKTTAASKRKADKVSINLSSFK